MKTGGASTSRWEPSNDRDPRRNSYPPPAHVTAHGQSRFSSPGPWPRQRPSHYSNAPGGYDPYQRDAQQRHSGNRQYGGHSQYGGYSQGNRDSPYSRDGYGRDGRDSRGYGRDGGGYDRTDSYSGYGNREHDDPRRRSTG